MIKLDNLVIGKEYKITQEIKEGEIIFFYSRNNDLIKELFLDISGINRSQGVLYQNQPCYENEQYFKHRVYLSFEIKLIKTILPEYIASSFLKDYYLKCNIEKLNEVINDLSIRQECDMNNQQPFTEIGNTLINFALIQSINKSIIMVNNPTINLTCEKHLNYITTSLTTPNHQTKLIGINNLSHFDGLVNKMIIFNDYGRTLMLNPSKTPIALISGDARGILTIIKDYQRLFFTYKNDHFQLVFINDLDKNQQRELNRGNYKIHKISFYEIEKYI